MCNCCVTIFIYIYEALSHQGVTLIDHYPKPKNKPYEKNDFKLQRIDNADEVL